MKRKIILLYLITILMLISACAKKPIDNQDDTNSDDEIEDIVSAFTPSSPVSLFTLEDIQALAINFSGSDMEIAQAIYEWQTEYMDYEAFGEVADAMRWNYFLPGIYTTRDMIKGFSIMDSINIKGLCYQFATIYCSIASYYDIECRVTAMREKPSELDPSIDKRTTTGLGPDEYARLEAFLATKGLYYSYETIRQVAKETSAHYRAEINIDGIWQYMDATEYFVGGEYNNTYEFYEVDWLEGYQPTLLQK